MVAFRRCTYDDIRLLLNIDSRERSYWNEQHFIDELANPYSTSLVITDEDTDTEIFGFLFYRTNCPYWEILNLWVAPELRGQGHAHLLLQKLISHALKDTVEGIILEVRSSNERAIFFYQKNFFFIERRRKFFYSDGEDAYTMKLQFQKSI